MESELSGRVGREGGRRGGLKEFIYIRYRQRMSKGVRASRVETAAPVEWPEWPG